MKKEAGNTIKLGVFVTLGLVFLTIAIYLIGNKQNMFGDKFRISAVFRNVNGLQTGNNVRFSGINVGTVEQITILTDSTVQVDMVIDESVRQFLKKDAVASIGSDGLVGNMLVNISAGHGSGDPVENYDIIATYSRIETGDIINTLGATNENIAILSRDLLEITEKIRRGKGTLATLLTDTSLAWNIKNTMANINEASEKTVHLTVQVQTMVDEINQGQGLVGTLLKDTIFNHSLTTIMVQLQRTTNEIDAITANLNQAAKTINQGEGMATMLLNDTTMVNDLRQTLVNVNEGTARFNENMEALKHNFLFRNYFRKQAKKDGKNSGN